MDKWDKLGAIATVVGYFGIWVVVGIALGLVHLSVTGNIR
jgi:hypothetical protein